MEERFLEPAVISSEDKRQMKRRSLYYTLSGFLIAFFIICLFIFRNMIQESDSALLKAIQSWFPSAMYSNGFFKFCTNLVYYYTNFNVVNCAICFLYCSFHPFIVLKAALVVNFSVLMHTLLVLHIYMEPKPYWQNKGMNSYECRSVFTGPSYSLLLSTLITFYVVAMNKKYGTPQRLRIILASVLGSLNVFALIINVLNAENFLYQNLLGILMAGLIVIIAYLYDNEVSLIALKLGFFVWGSKKKKFLYLVSLLLLLATCLALAAGMDEVLLIKAEWVQNYMVLLDIVATEEIN